MSQQTVTDERQREMLVKFEAGMTYNELAVEFGMLPDEVSRLMAAMGAYKKKVRRRHNQVYDLVTEGKSMKEISNETGYGVGSLDSLRAKQRHLRKGVIPKRSQGVKK